MKEVISQEVIENFLNGGDPEEFIVGVIQGGARHKLSVAVTVAPPDEVADQLDT